MARKKIEGLKFGKLAVLEEAGDLGMKYMKCRCVCECGSRRVVAFDKLRSGRVGACRECTKKAWTDRRIRERGKTLEEVAKFYRRRGITFPDGSFRKATDRHSLRCDVCGHVWQSTFANSRRRGCPKCAVKENAKRLSRSLSDVCRVSEERGVEFLDREYRNQMEKHRFRCLRCGAEFVSTVHNVVKSKHGHACRLGLDFVRDFCGKRGIEFLDGWFDAIDDRHEYRCAKCGRVWNTQFSHIYYSETAGCPKCHRFGFSGEHTLGLILDEIFAGHQVTRQFRIRTYNEELGKIVVQSLDFFVEDLRLAVEFNGREHYEPVRFEGRLGTDVSVQERRDARKRMWCAENGVKLVEVDGRPFERNVGLMTKDTIAGILHENGELYAQLKTEHLLTSASRLAV